jgi:hypothetical protein
MSGLYDLLSELLESCNFDVIYQTPEYMMAREVPGQIAFSKLVTVEVLIDRTVATDDAVRMSFVIKNEELPLQVDNHCRQMFDLVSQAVAQSSHLRLIDAVAG